MGIHSPAGGPRGGAPMAKLDQTREPVKLIINILGSYLPRYFNNWNMELDTPSPSMGSKGPINPIPLFNITSVRLKVE